MPFSNIDESQRRAARVVGIAYLLAMVTANFAEFYVAGRLIVQDNAAETARNIMAHERLFRLGIASEFMTWAIDTVLLAALYVVLKPVDRSLALLAACFRLIETSILVAMTSSSLDLLRVLSGADYLRVFEPGLQALARLYIGAHGTGFNVGLMFFGLGSTVYCYLWLRSNYIPKALAALGVLGSSLVAAGSFLFIIFPSLADILIPGYFAPIFVFELTMGFWLLFKGIRP